MRVALHVHTNYSACSESPVEEIAEYCRRHDIGAIAITDHNSIDGALQLREVAPGLQVIIGEEISTRQGEVVGLFLKDEILADLDLRPTCEQIKAQGGLVYVPHPFDKFKTHRVRSRHLEAILDLVDIIEVFNGKISLGIYNARALAYAARVNKVGAVGSDSHYVTSIDSAINVMDPFTGPEDFCEKLARAEFETRSGSLLYTWWVRARKLFGNRPA